MAARPLLTGFIVNKDVEWWRVFQFDKNVTDHRWFDFYCTTNGYSLNALTTRPLNAKDLRNKKALCEWLAVQNRITSSASIQASVPLSRFLPQLNSPRHSHPTCSHPSCCRPRRGDTKSELQSVRESMRRKEHIAVSDASADKKEDSELESTRFAGGFVTVTMAW